MNNTSQLKQKIIITISILLTARLGIFIPIPGIDHNALQNSFTQNGILNFLNIFSGGGFAIIGLFALGIVPYINSSIIIQILAKIIPEIENWQKEEGESGRQKITQLTRYLTLLWAILQSIGISLWIKPYVFSWGPEFLITCITTLTTGSIIIMWFGEIITEFGLGNGPSLLIFQNIISGITKNLTNYSFKVDIYNNENIYLLVLTIVFFISMLIITVLIQESTRKINIVSARQLSKISEINPQSYIPIKLNQGGVMPIIFASAAMALPMYLNHSFQKTNLKALFILFTPNSLSYLAIYLLLIIAFSYFYSSLILNPKDISKNLKKMGASIPNIRPGIDTEKYLQKILYRLTLLGACFLFLIALVPSIISNIANLNALRGLGATSLLILVNVAIDTAKQIQTYVISQQYDNIME